MIAPAICRIAGNLGMPISVFLLSIFLCSSCAGKYFIVVLEDHKPSCEQAFPGLVAELSLSGLHSSGWKLIDAIAPAIPGDVTGLLGEDASAWRCPSRFYGEGDFHVVHMAIPSHGLFSAEPRSFYVHRQYPYTDTGIMLLSLPNGSLGCIELGTGVIRSIDQHKDIRPPFLDAKISGGRISVPIIPGSAIYGLDRLRLPDWWYNIGQLSMPSHEIDITKYAVDGNGDVFYSEVEVAIMGQKPDGGAVFPRLLRDMQIRSPVGNVQQDRSALDLEPNVPYIVSTVVKGDTPLYNIFRIEAVHIPNAVDPSPTLSVLPLLCNSLSPYAHTLLLVDDKDGTARQMISKAKRSEVVEEIILDFKSRSDRMGWGVGTISQECAARIQAIVTR